MAEYVFRTPDIGEGVAEVEIVAWHVKPGETVAEDQPLVDLMTDKATVEITSPVDGKLVSTAGEPGAKAAVGSVLAVLEVGAEAATSTPAAAPEPTRAVEAPVAAAPPAPAPAPVATAAPAAVAPALVARAPGAAPLASPAVRRRAQQLGVRLQFVPATGPAGRVTREDLDRFVAAGETVAAPAAAPAVRTGVEEVKVIGLRRQIAERMSEAKRRIPHFSYIEEVDVTELERLRGELNAQAADRPRLTLLPFLIRAVTRTLPRYPQINATYDDEAGVVRRHAAVHLGLATQTPTGLVVPVLRHAEALDLWAAATEIARLASACRAGKATRDELSGSTITLTSLGPLGGLATTPVINRPEVAILGPNKIVERPVVVGGQVVVRKMMNLSSSFDHRVVDGWDAAEFIQAIKRLLETPALLFVEAR
ncbi:dihydrolipoamide acetyltransferase family protein [Phenylobacterium sp. LjRoot219]|uniref:dihydrolipoamide acetyltransferase family protein n=1 Tax=Phenylobacterium sp. LjRoot219 TaxID=3342283 RepID=UPI003ECC9C0D